MNDYQYNDDPIVNVPVPRSRLSDVYRILSEPPMSEKVRPAEQSRPAEQPEPVEHAEDAAETRIDGWTASMIRQYEVELTHPLARKLLTLAAQHAPYVITIEEVLKETGGQFATIAGAKAAQTKTAKRMFPGVTPPVSVRQDGVTGTSRYWVHPEIAKWWLEACGEASHA